MPKGGSNPVIDKKIENLFNEYYERTLAGENVNLYKLQKKYGYADSTAKSYRVTKTKSWQRCLDKVKDDALLDKLTDIALNAAKDSDAIRAIDKLFQLKNRYPDKGKSSGVTFQTQINNLLTEEEEVDEIEGEIED